jgi:hypothetical protein
MPLPTRPVASATIETDWGQQIHDDTFAPKGFSAHTVTTASVGASFVGVHFDVADDDPGGWLDAANDRAVAPTGCEGLYLIVARFNTVDGTDGDQTMFGVYVNGSLVSSGFAVNDGGTNVPGLVVDMYDVAAGDVFQVKARKRGSGANPTVTLTSFKAVRLGREFGA